MPSAKKICLVYYHGNDWDGVRARQRYLLQALSGRFRIIYLDGTWSRRGWITARKPEPGVTVVAGLVSLLNALERRSLGWLGRWVGAAFAALFRRRDEQFVFWNAENSSCPFRFIPHARLIFDCIDPSFSEDPAGVAAFHARESAMLGKADLVFASAESLVERCRGENPNTYLLNNACEPTEYAEELIARTTQPAWWPAGARPIAAYLGSLDWRFDFALMTAVAERSPQVDFILAGNVIPECKLLAERLQALPNVICPGRISVEEGRHLIAHCAVGLIPFRPGPMNDGVNPVKLYAYALLGKPIVGTLSRELCARPEVVLIGETAERFAAHIASAVEGSAAAPSPETLRAFAVSNTWKERAQTVVEVFRKIGWTADASQSETRSATRQSTPALTSAPLLP